MCAGCKEGVNGGFGERGRSSPCHSLCAMLLMVMSDPARAFPYAESSSWPTPRTYAFSFASLTHFLACPSPPQGAGVRERCDGEEHAPPPLSADFAVAPLVPVAVGADVPPDGPLGLLLLLQVSSGALRQGLGRCAFVCACVHLWDETARQQGRRSIVELMFLSNTARGKDSAGVCTCVLACICARTLSG